MKKIITTLILTFSSIYIYSQKTNVSNDTLSFFLMKCFLRYNKTLFTNHHLTGLI